MGPLRWADLYNEAELYKAAVRLYTKPLFSWRKALGSSTDGRSLYDFARRGLRNLEALDRRLGREEFFFRPGLAWRLNLNGRRRTFYIYPWEERLVDLLLYRLLSRACADRFSPHSYAYRLGGGGVDLCQRRIARALRGPGPLHVVKRDIREFFDSIDHDLLLEKVRGLCETGGYLERLLESRVRFRHQEGVAVRGVPFGTAIACFFANLYLEDLDRALAAVPGARFYRYADDILVVAQGAEAARASSRAIDRALEGLRLLSKPSHAVDLAWRPGARLRHLGLEFRAGAPAGLSRDKTRKIMNLFRYAFRRRRGAVARLREPEARARLLAGLARKVTEDGVRNVAIVDYYLKHVEDEGQLRLIDRWLAEEVLARSFGGGRRKGRFGRLGFGALRAMGLPSLVHRRRLIRHGRVDAPFFIWQRHQAARTRSGTAARAASGASRAAPRPFPPLPEAAAAATTS